LTTGSGPLTRQDLGPPWALSGNELRVKRRIKPAYFILPEPTKATLGVRLRYLRQQAVLTIEELCRKTGVSTGAIPKLERDKAPVLRPWVLERILPFLSKSLKQAFPESGGDPYDFLVPPVTFGKWLRNQGMRLALQVKDFATRLRVEEFTVIRYEADQSRPDPAVQQRLRRLLKLDGKPLPFLEDGRNRPDD